jgi:hypothetical protein
VGRSAPLRRDLGSQLRPLIFTFCAGIAAR